MKQILSLLIVLQAASSIGQVFLKDTKNWNDLYVFYATNDGTMHETHSYFIGGDSIINKNTYKVLFDSTFRANANSDIIEVSKKEFIRESNSGNEIFYIENGTNQDIKIYDFGFDANASLTIGLNTYTVHSTDSIEVLGVKRKILYLSEDVGNGLFWISGIGSNKGLFYFQYQDALLLCVKDNNELLYKNEENYDCVFYDFIYSIEENRNSDIRVYPNPTSDKFLISSDEKIKKLDIFNYSGKLILSASPEMTDYVVDLYNHGNGIYFVRVDDITIKMIKK